MSNNWVGNSWITTNVPKAFPKTQLSPCQKSTVEYFCKIITNFYKSGKLRKQRCILGPCQTSIEFFERKVTVRNR